MGLGQTMETRFQDQGQTIYNFLDEFLVECPQCSACALVITLAKNPEKISLFDQRRLVCQKCGHTSDWDRKTVATGGNIDPYFQLPLWLQTPCCGEMLWAYNHKHLNHLEKIVQAKLRENKLGPGPKKTMMTQLPAWIMSAKNRNEVLKGIAKLRSKE